MKQQNASHRLLRIEMIALALPTITWRTQNKTADDWDHSWNGYLVEQMKHR
jgi:hypothetical protein